VDQSHLVGRFVTSASTVHSIPGLSCAHRCRSYRECLYKRNITGVSNSFPIIQGGFAAVAAPVMGPVADVVRPLILA
jgi:hypothetical protein